MAKFTKTEVDYSKGKPQAHCGICEHFRPNSKSCVLVEGDIEPDMWCRKFERGLRDTIRAALKANRE